jgi:transposase
MPRPVARGPQVVLALGRVDEARAQRGEVVCHALVQRTCAACSTPQAPRIRRRSAASWSGTRLLASARVEPVPNSM